MALAGHVAQDLVRVNQRRRHEFRRLVAGIAKHDALIPGTFIRKGPRPLIHAHGDVEGLAMQPVREIQPVPVEAILLIANVADRGAHSGLDPVRRHAVGATDLAEKGNTIGRRRRLAGHPDPGRVKIPLKRGLKIQVHNFIGHPVTDLVGVTFRNALAGKKEF